MLFESVVIEGRATKKRSPKPNSITFVDAHLIPMPGCGTHRHFEFHNVAIGLDD